MRSVTHHLANGISGLDTSGEKIQYFIANGRIRNVLAGYGPHTRANPGAATADTDAGRRNRHPVHPGPLAVPDNRKRHALFSFVMRVR